MPVVSSGEFDPGGGLVDTPRVTEGIVTFLERFWTKPDGTIVAYTEDEVAARRALNPKTTTTMPHGLFERVRDRANRGPMEPVVGLPDAELAFAIFMQCLGLNPEQNPHLADTPRRVARMYAEVLGGGEPFDFTTFPSEVDQMVFVGHIPFTSFCAHHLLPFTGEAHVAYVPQGKIAGLSKLARTVSAMAARPQVQENLTEQVADALVEALAPRGVGVVLQARHACMELRGAKAVGALTVTSCLRGLFREDPAARAEFFALVNRGN